LIGVYQATHSSTPHGSMLLSVEVWMPGMPLLSTQLSTRA
jgi:hypothetical protein